MIDGMVYLSYRGVTDDSECRVRSRMAELKLLQLGWRWEQIVTPKRLCDARWSRLRKRVHCLRAERCCGWVAMAPGWDEAPWARLEHWLARRWGKKIIYL